jgi:hypothetical protein
LWYAFLASLWDSLSRIPPALQQLLYH